MAGLVAPSASLHTTNRDLGFHVCSNQNTRVQDPVLLGSNQFFAFEKQNSQIPLVIDTQVGGPSQLQRCSSTVTVPLLMASSDKS